MLQPGRVIGRKYVVESLLGSGIEGEVYRVKETRTGITRAAKVFFPSREVNARISTWHARKLDKLRHCAGVLQYFHVETVQASRRTLTCLISEFLDGRPLHAFLQAQPKKRLTPFEALHLTHSICCGLESIHEQREYHGDLHSLNIFVKRRGIFFDVKFIDFYHRGRSTKSERQDDLLDVIYLLYDMVGGRPSYASQPPEVKSICLGLRRDMILKRFPGVSALRKHLESFTWSR